MKQNNKYKLSNNTKKGRLIHLLIFVFLFSITLLIMLFFNTNLIFNNPYLFILLILLLFGVIYIYYNYFDWDVYLLDDGYKIEITKGKKIYVFKLDENINLSIKSYGLRTIYFQVFKLKINKKSFHVKFKPTKHPITLSSYGSYVEKVENKVKSEIYEYRNVKNISKKK